MEEGAMGGDVAVKARVEVIFNSFDVLISVGAALVESA